MVAKLLEKEKDVILTAVAEPVYASRQLAFTRFGVPPSRCYEDADEFFAQGKICDAVFICTQDAQHCQMTLRALETGYDVCLEKPAAASVGECLLIRDTAKRLGRKVMLTHVLRYAPFYRCIKRLITDGSLGEIADFDQTENVAYWHFALSYVRGPWRDMKESTPTIVAKCCHDLDILRWLMDKRCESVSSYGSRFYFNERHAPDGSATHCVDCEPGTRELCPYDAYKVYPERMENFVVGGTARLKGKNIFDILREKKEIISRCVFYCGNDSIDNQVVNMRFEDGSTGHLTMTAFSQDCHRTIAVHGTKGEAYGDVEEAVLHVNRYGGTRETIDVNKFFNEDGVDLSGGHGGGDYYLLKDFIDYITVDSPSVTRTTIEDSLESHIIGFKAEESRLCGGKSIKIIDWEAKNE